MPVNKNHFERYIDYINNAENPKIEHFDEDWEPIGAKIREDMKQAQLIYEKDGKVYLDPNSL